MRGPRGRGSAPAMPRFMHVTSQLWRIEEIVMRATLGCNLQAGTGHIGGFLMWMILIPSAFVRTPATCSNIPNIPRYTRHRVVTDSNFSCRTALTKGSSRHAHLSSVSPVSQNLAAGNDLYNQCRNSSRNQCTSR